MSLDWDVLLDDVSIKDQIVQFEIRDSYGGYARELLISTVDPSFYDQFDVGVLPELRLEVKIKEDSTWVSLGEFYIEEPAISVDPDKTESSGVWGRSKTAKAGAPFAPKYTQSWLTDTTASTIISEMADLVDLDVDFQITDYTVFANTYAADTAYPIEVIDELAKYAGCTVGCTAEGSLIIRSTTFHPTIADHTITDIDIIDMSESVESPEFGNRIKISPDGTDSVLSVTIAALNDVDCLPADGESTTILYAFVSNDEGPVEDGVVVTWTCDDGLVLANETSSTGQLLISNMVYNADNYYQVTVDFPIKEITGIWAYGDRQHTNNFWDDALIGCTFEDNVITVHNPFDYCDQTLTITYLTSGCAINTVTAGSTAQDLTVTADVGGSQGTIEIKLGNTCACGSSLNMIKNTDSDICYGNTAPILIWAEINGGPATGMIATLSLTSGCGELSSTKKILATVAVTNEIGYVVNEISGSSQVESAAFIDDSVTPSVYLTTDTSKTNNLYLSHIGKTIDLDTDIDTGVEVWIDYTADGAAAVSWMTTDVTADCDTDITAKIADGTEAGLSETISLSATDCSDDDDDDATDNDYSSDDDPDGFDYDGEDGGTSTCVENCRSTYESGAEREACIDACNDPAGGGGGLSDCATIILNRMSNIANATAETIDEIRFAPSSIDCSQEDPYGCSCEELCESEIREHGNTYDYNQTIHEVVTETYAYESAEYYEEYARVRSENVSDCVDKCEDSRNILCECEGGTGPEVMSPGETAEFVCSDGTVDLITMPEDACGTLTFVVGCCIFAVRSTAGSWVLTDSYSCPQYSGSGYYVLTCEYEIISETEKRVGLIGKVCATDGRFDNSGTFFSDWEAACNTPDTSVCQLASCDETYPERFTIHINEAVYTWEC